MAQAPVDPSALTDHQLLTLVLGASRQPLSEKLTQTYGDLRSIATAPPGELREHGLTTAAIDRLLVVFEVARRYGETPWRIGDTLRGASDVYGHFRECLAAETTEHFYAVLLDTKHRLLKSVLVSKGSLTSSVVHPRDVFAPVVRFQAGAVLFVHNHPSGDPTPSKEDIEITQRLRAVGELLGVRVLDHIIIGKGRYVSLVDDGCW